MSITKVIKGDLIKLFKEGLFDLIGHGCNCMQVYGGIAHTITSEFPTVSVNDGVYNSFPVGVVNESIAGTVVTSKTQYGRIANLYIQKLSGANADYSLLESTLINLNKFCRLRGIKFVGLPLIGAGIGGLDVKAVLPIINNTLTYPNVTIVAYSDADYNLIKDYELKHPIQWFTGTIEVISENEIKLGAIIDGRPQFVTLGKKDESNPMEGALVTPVSSETFKGLSTRAITLKNSPAIYAFVKSHKQAVRLFGLESDKFRKNHMKSKQIA